MSQISSRNVGIKRGIRPWAWFFFNVFLIWVFGWVVGPFIEHTIPVYNKIGQVVEERNIDSAAYMYQNSVGSYDGEYFLTDSFKHSKRQDYGLTPAFLSGILGCFLILWIGWHTVMK